MNRMRLGWGLALVLACLSLAAFAQQTYKAESIGAYGGSELDPAMKDALQPQGVRVSGGDTTLCDVWLRKVVPQKAAGADYKSLATGTFVGVITYTGKAGDYRGQVIKPGTYVMRYQTIPKDGNHMGASPTPHFFLLTPAAEDKDPSAVLDYKTLLQLSRKASGTNHPLNLYLATPANGGKPGFNSIEEGRWALETATKAQPAGGSETDLPVAIVLIGKCEA